MRNTTIGMFAIAVTIGVLNIAAQCYVNDGSQECPTDINTPYGTCTIAVGTTNYHWVKNVPTGMNLVTEDPQCSYYCADGLTHIYYPGYHAGNGNCGA